MSKGKFDFFKRAVMKSLLLLLVPITIVGFINFIIQQQSDFREMEQSIKVEMNRQTAFWNNEFTDINSLIYQISYSKLYNSYYRENSTDSTISIMQDLRVRNESHALFEAIMFYDTINNNVITAYGKYTEEEFFTQVVYNEEVMVTENLDEEHWSFEKVYMPTISDTAIAMFIPISDTVHGDNSADAYIVILISDETIYNQMASYNSAGSWMWFLEMGGEVVHSSDEGYNRQIFEDNFDYSDFTEEDYYTYKQSTIPEVSITWMVPKLDLLLQQIEIVVLQASLGMLMIISVCLMLFYNANKTYKPIKSMVNVIKGVTNSAHTDIDELDYINYGINSLITSHRYTSLWNEELKYEKALYHLFNYNINTGDAACDRFINLGIELNKERFKVVVFADVEENVNIYDFFDDKLSKLSPISSGHMLYTHSKSYICLICTDEAEEVIDEMLSALTSSGASISGGDWITDISMIRDSYFKIKMLGIPVVEELPPETPLITDKKANYRRKSIENILTYIDENFTDMNFSIKSLAAEFDTSPSNISHFFKKCTGQSISVFVEMKRLQEAKLLLQTKKYKVKDIAELVGYSNTSTLIEVFKKYEGMTPRAYMSAENL